MSRIKNSIRCYRKYEKEMLIFADTGVLDKEGIPENVKVCQRGTWNLRMVVEGVFSLLTRGVSKQENVLQSMGIF